jgi:predicted DNA-binding ribbon-helix-helix protein
MENKVVEKRISVVVEEEFLLELKKRALNRNITLKKYVIRALIEKLTKERQYDAQGGIRDV